MDVVLTLKILLAGVAIVFLLLLVCLTAPLTYTFTLYRTQGQLGFHMVCHNFFWEMSTRLSDSRVATQQRILNQSLSKTSKSKPSSATHPAGDARDAMGKPNPMASLLRKSVGDSALHRRILAFIREIWQTIKPHHLTVNACIGCSEPHQTGWLMAVAALLQADNSCYTIHIEGNWLEAGLEGDLDMRGKFIPAVVVWHTVKFLASSQTRAYYRFYRQLAKTT